MDTAAHRTLLWLQMEQQLQFQQAPAPIGGSKEGGNDGAASVSESSADSLRQRLLRRQIRTVKKLDPKTSLPASARSSITFKRLYIWAEQAWRKIRHF